MQKYARKRTHARSNETEAARRFRGCDVSDVVVVIDCLLRRQSLGEIPLTDGPEFNEPG